MLSWKVPAVLLLMAVLTFVTVIVPDGLIRTEAETADMTASSYDVSIVKPKGWGSTIFCYAYNANGNNTSWPGVAMKDLGNGLYGYDLPYYFDSAKVIFTDGTRQYPAREGKNDGLDWSIGTSMQYSDGSWTDITAEQKAVIKGYVRDEGGSGLSGVRIDLFAKEDEDRSSSEADFSAYTNPNGYYEIDHVPYGTYAKVIFSLNGYDIKLVSYIAVNSGEKLMSATLKGETESSTFSGEVRDTYGNPVRFARVDLYDETGESVFSGYSDENGRYRITGVSYGTYAKVVAAKTGYESYTYDNLQFSVSIKNCDFSLIRTQMGSYDVYIEKPENWSNELYCYVYNKEGNNGLWPGVRMDHLGNGLYAYDLPESYKTAKVIFSDGTHQYPAHQGTNDGVFWIEASPMILERDYDWMPYSEAADEADDTASGES